MNRVLITGFEAFDGTQVNPSWTAVRMVESQPSPEPSIELHARLLPCRFGASLDELWSAVEQLDLDVVICVGQAGGRPEVSVERVAVNLDDARIPDNGGAQPIDRPIAPDGPAAYFATIPVKASVASVRALGVPAGLSNTAGTFVCNHVFYGLLHRSATLRPDLRGGFVHVPYLPGQGTPALSAEDIAAELRTIAVTAAGQRHDVPLVEGALH
jgi:pyroglutamyl-peptidase